MVNVYKILPKTSAEGPGVRFCIWVQGCRKHCKGCRAEDTWDFGTGTEYSAVDLFAMIKQQRNIEGVTFLGGEPFEQAEELSGLAAKIRETGLSVVCFTGYTLEELKKQKGADDFLKQIDLLIDGGFEQKNFDLSRPWVGSSNQRYIYLTDRYSPDEISRCKNKIEMRINQNGRLEINGMGDFDKLEKYLGLQTTGNKLK